MESKSWAGISAVMGSISTGGDIEPRADRTGSDSTNTASEDVGIPMGIVRLQGSVGRRFYSTFFPFESCFYSLW